MTRENCQPVFCGSNVAGLGGLPTHDFMALDSLAAKLICLDSVFSEPLRKVGFLMGQRIAGERDERPITFEAALSALIASCGLEGVIQSRFLRSDADNAVLEISGCSEALDWRVEKVERTVCVFDAGLFEGFLRGVTGQNGVSVEERACLGLGHPCCQFVIRKGEQNDRC